MKSKRICMVCRKIEFGGSGKSRRNPAKRNLERGKRQPGTSLRRPASQGSKAALTVQQNKGKCAYSEQKDSDTQHRKIIQRHEMEFLDLKRSRNWHVVGLGTKAYAFKPFIVRGCGVKGSGPAPGASHGN